jgi:hypothetical protein
MSNTAGNSTQIREPRERTTLIDLELRDKRLPVGSQGSAERTRSRTLRSTDGRTMGSEGSLAEP